LVSNPFKDIVGPDFPCADNPPAQDEDCPALSMAQGGLQFDPESGEWTCPRCLAVCGIDNEPLDFEDDMFDDEEEAFDNDEVYVAEGAQIQDQDDEARARVGRIRAAEMIVAQIAPANRDFARFVDINQYLIIDRLRMFESQGEPIFEQTKSLIVKVLAVAIHMSGKALDDSQIRLTNANPTRVRAILTILSSLDANKARLDPVVEKMFYVGNAVSLPDPVVKIYVEQYERLSPIPNREPDETTRAAAWIFIQAKHSKIKSVTKTALKKVPGVKQNALDRAVDSYLKFLSNKDKPVEGVV